MTVAGAEGEEGGQLDTVWPLSFYLSPIELWQPQSLTSGCLESEGGAGFGPAFLLLASGPRLFCTLRLYAVY